MVLIATAREWLRIDGTDNDVIIQGLLDAVPTISDCNRPNTNAQASSHY